MITVATVRPWQYSSPTGGLVTSEWLTADALEPGHVVRHHGAWVPIVSVEHRIGVGLIVTLDTPDQARLWMYGSGMEVRQDMRWDPVPVRACGCWVTESGSWTCDKHLHLRRAVPA